MAFFPSIDNFFGNININVNGAISHMKILFHLKMVKWLTTICAAAVALICQSAHVNNSNDYMFVFTDVNIKYNATIGNVSFVIGNNSDVTVILNTFQYIFDGSFRLFVEMQKPTEKSFTTILNYTVNWCEFMERPLSEPLVNAVYEQAKLDKRNKVFGKCPIAPVNIL